MTPVAVTGFNRDVILENTASGPPYSSYALEFNPGEGTAFYQNGLPGTSYGLPVSGSFNSAVGDGTVFQFQPYTGSNALVLSSETGLTAGTLTLVTANTFSRIAIIANSASATATSTGTLTLNFSDSTSFVTNYNAQDWFFNPGFALQGVDRINISSGGTSGGPAGDPRFYQTTVDLAAALGPTNKPLVSLTFGKASSANSTAVYAVSGLPTSAITLPAVTNAPAANIQARAAMLGGQVTATGGEAPAITLYYGTADGSNNAASWGQNVALGLQGGSFSQTVSSLTPNTVYYFTAKAANSAGTAWATPSKSFSTPPLTAPIVTNLPASNVQATLATLNGQILSTGGETPTVTLYYGTSNGGSNPGAWAHNLALGAQTGVFAQTVTGLSPTTAYFFTASASNSAGTSWAIASQSFSTSASNSPSSAVAVLTQHNDNGRTGMNLNETVLNVSNVNTNTFGLLYSRPLDDQVYAQPLIMTNVNILGRGTHNLLIVGTVNDTIYAFDADDPSVTAPYWQVSFLETNVVAPRNSDMTGACGGNYQDFSGKFGIVGAPVIDPAAGTLYVVARTKEFNTNFVQRLHALDITSGAERPNSPVVIAATNGVAFDPYKQNQRPALLLANGYVFISWSSHCDWGPYHGWVMGYNTANLLQAPITFNDTPSGSLAGIWMSNQGPVADTNGNVYLSTGNGTFDGVSNFGETLCRLTPNGAQLSLTSWFTPYNWNALNGADNDLSCGGVLLIPKTPFLLTGGKEGKLYVVNSTNMGGLSGSTTADTNIVQSWSWAGTAVHSIHGGPVWWDGPTAAYAYIWGASGDQLRQFQFNRSTGKFNTTAFALGSTVGGSGQPGGILAVSANGTNANTGIIWASVNTVNDANQSTVMGTLHAYNAQNVATELWNSDMTGGQDAIGNFAKFVAPTVANGRVYMATFSSQLNVYGLFASQAALLAVSPPSLNFGTVAVGSNSQTSFLVSNNGSAPLTNGTAGLAVFASPFTIVSGTPFNLSIGGTTNLMVQFAPGSAANFSNAVVFTTGNGGDSTNTVTGTGALVPAAGFSASPTNGAWPLPVSFTDTSSGTITNRLWNFGDGSTTNTYLTSLTHAYAGSGTNTVALTVTGPVGTNTLTRAAYIVVSNPPPLLSVSPAGLSYGLVVIGQSITQSFQVVNSGVATLAGSAATTPPFAILGGSPFSLPGGQTGLVQVSFSPASSGSFSNVAVFSSNGGSSTNSLTGIGLTPPRLWVSPLSLSFGTIAVGSNAQANFVITNQGGTALSNGLATVSAGPFTILSGTPFSLPAFGTTNLVLRFAPTAAASFTNTVTVTTGNGGNSTNTVTGMGALVPAAGFSASPTGGAWPLPVSFTDTSTGTITNHFWNFGDGSTTNTSLTGFTHAYAGAGTNTVVLTVTGPVGSDSLTRANYIIVTNPGPVVLTIRLTNNLVQISWSSGTLQTATLVTGPFTNISGAVSPYTLPRAEAIRFFRVQVR